MYVERSLEDEQLLIRQLLQECKNVNMAGGWKLKFTFCILERTHEPLHLVKWSFVRWKSRTYLQVLFASLFSLIELLNMEAFRNYEVILVQTLNYFV
jgi:hypothetical protein